MDLLESGDEREPLRLGRLVGARLPGWAVAVVAVAVSLVLPASLVGAVAVDRSLERDAGRPLVELRVVEGSSSTVSGVARGTLVLLLVNRGRDPVQVDLGFFVEGLRLTDTVAEPLVPLQPGAERLVRVAYVIPSCTSLVLPGRVLLGVESERERVERFQPVVDPEVGRLSPDALPLGACPGSARSGRPGEPTDVGARPAGGQARRVGAGAEGTARLEVRNGGAPVRLLAVDARVPGVVFTPRLLAGGLELPPDGLAIVTLRFRVPDCARLQPTGWLVLRVERFGAEQEVGLRLTAEPAAGLGPQARLPIVLESCQ